MQKPLECEKTGATRTPLAVTKGNKSTCRGEELTALHGQASANIQTEGHAGSVEVQKGNAG